MRVALLSCVLVVGGCDLYEAPASPVDAAPPALPDAAPPPAATAYESMMATVKVACDDAFRCRDSCPYPDQFETTYGTSPADCVTKLDPSFEPTAAEVQASVDAGRILYRPDDATACLDWFSALACSDFWGTTTEAQPSVCYTAFQGTIATGGACTISMDCAVRTEQCTGTPMVCTAP